MLAEIKERIGRVFVEEQTRNIGIYTTEDGSLVSELTIAGQMHAEINPQNKIGETNVLERRIKPFGWKQLELSEPVFINNEQ